MVEKTNPAKKKPTEAAEESKGGKIKLNKLKSIEADMQEQFNEQKLYEAEHTNGYEKMTFD